MVDLENFTSLYAKRIADAGEADISIQVSLQFRRYYVAQACMYVVLAHTKIILESYLISSQKLF